MHTTKKFFQEVFDMTKILITGATGHVGGEVAKILKEEQTDFIAGVHTPEEAEFVKNLGYEPLVFDFMDSASMDYVFKNVDTMLLITPLAANTIHLVLSAVESALRNDVKHIVRLSSMTVDYAPESLLGYWHAESEKAIQVSEIPYTMLRPNVFMQNFIDTAALTIREEDKFYAPLVEAPISYVDVRDVARVAVNVMQESNHKGKTYTITGPEAVTPGRISTILSRVMGRGIQYVDISNERARDSFEKQGLPKWMTDVYMELFALMRSGRASKVTSAVKMITGKTPKHFEQFAEDYREIFEKQPQEVRV
jgi:uncharacterized protein YbjT (DUF2867 family)